MDHLLQLLQCLSPPADLFPKLRSSCGAEAIFRDWPRKCDWADFLGLCLPVPRWVFQRCILKFWKVTC